MFDPRTLLTRCRSNVSNQPCHLLEADHDFIHCGTGLMHQLCTAFNFVDRLGNQCLDFFRGSGAALSQITHLGGDHGKAAPLLTGPCRFNRSVECQNVGLESNAVDDTDDVGNPLRTGLDFAHRDHHLLDHLTAFDYAVIGALGQLVGLFGVVGILSDRGVQLFHRR